MKIVCTGLLVEAILLASTGAISPKGHRSARLGDAFGCLGGQCKPRSHAFLAVQTTSPREARVAELRAGWGRTERYSWTEDPISVTVSVVLEPSLLLEDLDVKIERDGLNVVNKRKPHFPLVSGATKGPVDVDGSFWTVEELGEIRELKLSLKKSDKEPGNWYGVIKNEVLKQQAYDNVTLHDASITRSQSLEPGGLFWHKEFPMIDVYQLQEILKRWMSRERTNEVPFGKPPLPARVGFVPDASGGKLVYQCDHPDIDEYLQIVIQPVMTEENKFSGGGSEIRFINSATTHVISGKLGAEQADRIRLALNTLIQSFEQDVHRLDGLIKHRQEKEATFDYLGSSCYLDADNLESYVNYHEELKKMGPTRQVQYDPKNVFKDKETGVEIDWNPTDDGPEVTKEENELKKKRLIQELTEVVKHTKNKQPEKTIRSLVEEVKRKLALNDVEYNQLLLNAGERIKRETEMLEKKQKLFSQLKTVSEIEESQPSLEELAAASVAKPDADTFDMAMNSPESSVLASKYATLSSVQKEQLRRRWKSNEKRLKLLITELMDAEPQKCPTICNNYRDLLISEDYPTLMKSYLCSHSTDEQHEKERLMFLNEFVLSLYKDQQILLIHDEKVQLQKIQQIIDWSCSDFEDINDKVMKNKQLYDNSFMCYLNLAISAELKRIQEEEKEESGGFSEISPTSPLKSPWLCILTIIHRAITCLIQADMAEDIYLIGFIAQFDNPKLRSYLLEFLLATMPRSDWKAFKDLILSASNSLINRPPEERDDLEGTEPHFAEAMLQMREDVEKMIPDWIIDELLSEDDRRFMIQTNRRKSPVLQLDLEPKHQQGATQLPETGSVPTKERHPVVRTT